MKPAGNSSVPWIVCGLVAALLCCLCLLVVIAVPTGALLWLPWWPVDGQPVPSPSVAASATAPESAGPTPAPYVLPRNVTPVSPLAEEGLRLLASVVVPEADPIFLVEQLQGVIDPPRVLAESAAPIPVGAVHTFWVQNEDTTEYFQIEADMVYDTPHVYFWVEQGVANVLADVERLADTFENQIYPTDREFFGSEWTPGVDGDPHIYILFTRGLGSWVAGYYGSNDEYSPLVNEFSNGHEMFYINADGQSLADEYTYSTLAHEFQHMIHWSLDANEDSWVDEGFAELATFLNGYDVGGWDYAFAEEPDIPLTFWPSGEDSSLHYGQSFLFMAYFLDRFGEEASQALAANQANGLGSVDQTLAALRITDPQTSAPITADDFFRDWAVTLLLQDPSVGDGRYSMRSYPGAPQLSAKTGYPSCPIAPQDLEVNQYGIDVIGLNCTGDYTLVFDGETMAQVVPADSHSGDWAFWSNRGNVSDMTLTRSFDFSGATGPIELSYWTWYDLEEDWDYVYLEASGDNGRTWQILTTPSGIGTDPTGNSYGWGYTGFSGGGTEGAWIEETVDLTTYAGGPVLLRFEYITDASVNGEGLLLDDISIQAAGYTEDFETGEGGWQAEGFVRLYNRLPQTYRVVLVETGGTTRVTEIALDEGRHAEVPLSLGGEYDQATLLVMGTSRYTWRPAPYRFEVRP